MKITVSKPFSYYIDGYNKKNFERGDYDVPEDCMNYARQNGFLILDKEADDVSNRASNVRRSKGTMPN